MMPSLRSDAPAPELTIYGQKYTGPRLHINGRDLPVITMDAETAFGKDYTLAKMSYTDYVRDPRMHVHCWSVKIGDNATKVYFPDEIPALFEAIPWADVAVVGHNLVFDGFILHEVYGIHPGFYVDTLSMARAVLGHSGRHNLDTVAKHYGLAGKVKQAALYDIKDKWELSQEEKNALALYATDDVDDTYAIFWKMLDELPETELKLIDITMKMACEPVMYVDVPLAQEALDEELGKKANALSKVGIPADEIMSNQKFAEQLRKLGVEPPMKISERTGQPAYAFSKGDLEFQALAQHPNPKVKDLYFARLAVKSTIGETRAGRFIEVGKDGQLLPCFLNYSAAHTHRWSGGNKMNLQNLGRGSKLRLSILAGAGHVLCVADSSNIEARVLAWLADQLDLLEAFAKNADPYSQFATRLFGYHVDKSKKMERQVGKVCVLGLGYGMGPMKFRDTLMKGQMGVKYEMSEAEALRTVQLYRTVNRRIAALWDRANEWIEAMILGVELKYKCLTIRKGEIELPGGLKLHYHDLKADIRMKGEDIVFDNITYATGINGRAKLYGGLLVENIVQALARCIIGDQMVQMYDEGMKITMMTHDEVVTRCLIEEADHRMERMYAIMKTSPDWAPGLVLDAEGGYDVNYSK